MPSLANSAIVHEETLINDSVDLFVSSLAVNGVAAGTDQLYLTTVAYYGDNTAVTVNTVTGGSGLTWTLQKKQCSERLTRMYLEVWQAYGSPGASFNVDVTLTGGGGTAITTVAVSRYSGADSTTPTEGGAGANTGGQNGACPGSGTDDTAASLSLTSSQNDSVLFAATHPRNSSMGTPDAAYTQRAANTTNADGGSAAFLYVHDRDLATAGTDSADHTLSSAKSWIMTGLVINPAAAGGSLLAEFWVDEAASGQVPTTLVDNAATPLNMPLTYVGSSPVWSDGTGGNRHLRFTGTDGTDTGGGIVDTDGTKIDNIHGSTQATLVAKYSMDDNGCTNNGERIFGISTGNSSSDGWFAIRERVLRDTLQVNWAGQSTGAYAIGNGTPKCPIDTAATVHWVVDTTQAVAADRVKAYIDGVAATVQVHSGALPAQNETIDLGTGTRRMFLGKPHNGIRTFRGRVWYAALYDSALSAATVASDATAINACDDLGGCAPTTTIGNVAEPGDVTIAPGAAITDLDNFTLVASSGTDTVTAATVTLGPAGAFNNIAQADITDTSNVAQCTAITDPGSNTLSFTGCTIPVTTTVTTFKVRITPKTHANMPAVPGASYAVTGTVTAFTSTNTQAGTDTGSATVTVDNLSPSNVTGAGATPGDTQATVSWTNPGGDFSNVLVLRNTATIGDVPTEGSSPAIDSTIGSSVVRYIASGTSFIDTGLTNGTPYFYRIFAKDTNGNYAATGVEVSATPASGGGSCSAMDISIASNDDDLEEYVSGGALDWGSSDLELGEEGTTPQIIGLRFLSLDIDQGATISNAYVEFTAQEVPKTATTDLTFHAEDEDTAPAFVNAASNISNRTTTTASVTWSNVPDWTVDGGQYQSTDISAVIQEVVDRPGWSNNNALVLIISSGTAGSNRVADSFSGGTPAKLHVECAAGATPAVTSAVAEIVGNGVITSATANSFSYDIDATIGGGDSGVNRVAITVPGTFGAPTITGVQVDGSGVAYTDNTSGNAISIDLTTKVTASSKITVLFNSDAPTTQDLTGVDFTSTVDDSGTGDAAQATTEGDGDGDAGDNNSWTVTTTDGGTAVLLVVADKTTPSAQDSAKKTLIETWGYTATMIEAIESQANFDAAVATSDVAYVSEEIDSTNLTNKLTNACIGVVSEEVVITSDLGVSTSYGGYTSDTIDITNSSHYITSSFSPAC